MQSLFMHELDVYMTELGAWWQQRDCVPDVSQDAHDVVCPGHVSHARCHAEPRLRTEMAKALPRQHC